VIGSRWGPLPLLEVTAPGDAVITLRLLVVSTMVILVVAITFVLVAIALRIGNVRRGRRWTRLERKWEDDLLEMLSGEIPEDPARFGVTADESLFFVSVLARYARRVSGRERALLAKLADPFLPHVERQLRSRVEEQRARAIQALRMFGGVRYERQIVGMLDDPARVVAMAAAAALATREMAHHADAVIARLPRFTSWRPRVVSGMLAQMGPGGAPRLRAMMVRGDVGPEARAVVVDALRILNDVTSADVAAGVLQGAVRPSVAELPSGESLPVAVLREGEPIVACLRLLGQVGSPTHAPAVRRHLHDADPSVRVAAVEALAAIGDDADAERFLHAVGDGSPIVGAEAARALAAIGRDDLLQSLARDGSERSLLAREVLHARPGGAR